jgi:CheY-like chemotaxis protein
MQDRPAGSSAATVLCVEGDLASLGMVERLVARRGGAATLFALQGRLAVELAAEHAPALIVLGQGLPDLPAEEVLRLLRADPRTARIPVLAGVAADADPEAGARLRASGADACLPSPFCPDALAAALDALVGAGGSVT